jgi:hypothetical protein
MNIACIESNCVGNGIELTPVTPLKYYLLSSTITKMTQIN